MSLFVRVQAEQLRVSEDPAVSQSSDGVVLPVETNELVPGVVPRAEMLNSEQPVTAGDDVRSQ